MDGKKKRPWHIACGSICEGGQMWREGCIGMTSHTVTTDNNENDGWTGKSRQSGMPSQRGQDRKRQGTSGCENGDGWRGGWRGG